MESRRGGASQEVPNGFAEMLRRLHALDDPAFNAVLAVARGKGWKTPVLAAVVGMNPAAVSKRIERARAVFPPPALTGLDPQERDRISAQHRVAVDNELRRRTGKHEVPDPISVRATIDHRQLPPSQIAALRGMQRIASKVNGAMPPGHPDRRVSEDFTAELARLIDQEGYTPYYLAGVLGITHRAVTSRLERHRMRTPCPSVAGTASGVYFNRKIGDPGQGAPRLTAAERAELRGLWQAYTDDKRGAKTALATKIDEYRGRGFTLANLAQTMSTKQMRVGYGALQAAMGEARAGRWVRSASELQEA